MLLKRIYYYLKKTKEPKKVPFNYESGHIQFLELKF